MSRRRSADTAVQLDQDDAIAVAHSLQEDFVGLIAIFDRQLAIKSAAVGEAQSKISDARTAAQRGLRLSQELAELLRSIR